MMRSTDDIIAEAKADQQDTPIKEPFELRLRNGHVVTFRDPQDIPVEQAATGMSSFREQLDAMITDRRDRTQFWREWGKVQQRYIGGLVTAIVDHYMGDGDEGKDKSPSGGSFTS